MEPPEILQFPLKFESKTLNNNFINFNGADTKVVDNPFTTGINVSSKIAPTIKSSEYSCSTLKLQIPIDFTDKKTLKILVWTSSESASLGLYFCNDQDQDQSFDFDLLKIPINN